MQPVDAVITWVDGFDPTHQEKLMQFLHSRGMERPSVAEPTRFNQCGEIDYCLRSLLAFAPWINKIFIITDNQCPAIIKNNPYQEKIELIDHKVIFKDFEKALPTFNSLSIETLLWRIPHLSEHFIYFNDDCFLIRPVSYEDFFQGEQLVVRGEWKKQQRARWFRKNKTIDDHRVAQEHSARIAGYTKHFFHLPHVPFPLNKALFENLTTAQLAHNVQFPFRNREQFWPISLAHHLALKEKKGIEDNSNLKAVMLNAQIHSVSKIKNRLEKADRNNQFAFACIQSMDCANEEKRQVLLEWLEKRIPILRAGRYAASSGCSGWFTDTVHPEETA